jgi:hypothetical protein
MTTRDCDGSFAARPRDAESWIKTSDPCSPGGGAADLHGPAHGRHHAQLARADQDRRFRSGITVADALRDLLAHEFPDTDGGRS